MGDHKALVLVVHGIGEQKKGDALKYTVEGFLPLIRNRIDPEVVVSANPLDDGPAQVTFEFDGPSRATAISRGLARQRYTLCCREVWWAESFNPPALGSVMFGLIRGLAQHFSERGARSMNPLEFIWRLLWEGFGRLALNLVKILLVPVLIILVALVVGCQFGIWLRRKTPGPLRWLWLPLVIAVRPRVRPALRAFLRDAQAALLDRLSQYQAVVVATIVIILSPLIVAVALVLWALEAPLPQAAIPPAVRGIHRSLVNILTNNWGDMWLYLYQPWEASRIRAKFEAGFKSFTGDLKPRDIEELDAVMVIAHSMGSTVAYEGLTGDELEPEIEKFTRFGTPKLYFVSVGSALNLSWDAAPPEETYRLNNRLSPAVDWFNIWAAYDPVGGQPLRLPGPALQSRRSAWSPGYLVPFSQREVVNQMDLFSDHSVYWNNTEEVIAPLLDALTARTLSADLLMDVRARHDRVRFLSLFKAIAWLTGPTLLITSLWAPALAVDDLRWVGSALDWAAEEILSEVKDFDWVLEGVSDIGENTWDIVEPLVNRIESAVEWLADIAGSLSDGVPDWVRESTGWLGDRISGVADWLGDKTAGFADWLYPDDANPGESVAVGVESGLVAWLLYATGVKWVWDLWDRSQKYKRPKVGRGD